MLMAMLGLLLGAATGAVAQTETLLTTINSKTYTGFRSGSKVFDGKAMVTFGGTARNDGDEWGWYSENNLTITVTPADGYIVTRVTFFCKEGSADDVTAPFEATVNDSELYVNGGHVATGGLTKIEVYGIVAATGVTLSQTEAALTVGDEALTLTATVQPANGTDKTVVWTTSDAAVATVADGVVTAVGAGTATITATATNGTADTSDDKKAQCTVTVTAPAPIPAIVSVTHTPEEGKGAEAVITYGDGTETLTPDETLLVGVKGKKLSVKPTAKLGWRVASVTLEQAPILVTAIELNKTETTIEKGEKKTLSVTAVIPDYATDKTCTWSSDNTSVATVDASTGEVTAVALGTANISATASDGSGVTASCAVTVVKPLPPFKKATTADIGKVIGADGNIYATKAEAVAANTTACAIIAYVGEAGSADNSDGSNSYRGLALALTDATSDRVAWHTTNGGTCVAQANGIGDARNDMDGIAQTNTLTSDDHTHAAAQNAKNYSAARPEGASQWFLPTLGQWNKMAKGLTGATADLATSQNSALNATAVDSKITAAGGTALQNFYWSSTMHSMGNAWLYVASEGYAYANPKTSECVVRAVLAF